MWRSVFLFFGTGSLGASESFIVDSRQGIRADRLPVASYGYTTFKIIKSQEKAKKVNGAKY